MTNIFCHVTTTTSKIENIFIICRIPCAKLLLFPSLFFVAKMIILKLNSRLLELCLPTGTAGRVVCVFSKYILRFHVSATNRLS